MSEYISKQTNEQLYASKFCQSFIGALTLRELADGEPYYWPAADLHCWKGLNSDYINLNPPKRLSSHVEHCNVMVQAGGNAGFFVRQYAKLFKSVYTFEPEPINFLCLTVNTLEYPNVLRFQAAIGFERKIINLKMNRMDYGGVHVEQDRIAGADITPWMHENVSVSTPCPTVLVDDLALPECNLLQFDLEGYEYYALLGAEKTIDQHRPVICIEWCWAESRYGIKLEMIETFLSRWNYELVDEISTDRVYKVKK